jgi:nucleotide-binding universal stress UspA family protein
MNASSASNPSGNGSAATTAAARFPPRRILLPLDLSAHSFQALPHAEGLAWLTGATLALLHVAEPIAYPTDLGYAPVISGEVEAGLHQSTRQRLDELVATLKARGLKAEASLRVGRPFMEIAEAARALAADLVVVTTHGFTGLKHVLLGSTAERVVRHAPCPVLVVRREAGREAPAAQPTSAPGGETSALRIQRVLMPVDFSEPSREALAYARQLAEQFHAELILAHVTELPFVDPNLAEIDTQTFEENARQSAQEQLDKAVAALRTAGITASGRLLTGVPWNEVVEFARREPVDLIVAGTHGYTGLKHILLGSTAERIIRHAPCPVLVVRHGPA